MSLITNKKNGLGFIMSKERVANIGLNQREQLVLLRK
jgi:hypothetical protein